MRNLNLLFFIFLGSISLTGCSKNNAKDIQSQSASSPPPGYIKLPATKKAITYLKKMDTWHYQGNPNVVQLEVIVSFYKEDEVIGKKFQSIKEHYLLNCATKNKYNKKPIGFFSDRYALGNPVVPYPYSAFRWAIAEEVSLESQLWSTYCVSLKDVIANAP